MTGMTRAAVLVTYLAAAFSTGAAHAQARPGKCAVELDESGRCPTKFEYRAYAGDPPPETRAHKLARLVIANWEGLQQCQSVASALSGRNGLSLRPQQLEAVKGIKEYAREIADEIKRDPKAFADRLDALRGHYDSASSFIALIKNTGGIRNFALNASGVAAPQPVGFKACNDAYSFGSDEHTTCIAKLGRTAGEAARQANATVAYFNETASVKCFNASGSVVRSMR